MADDPGESVGTDGPDESTSSDDDPTAEGPQPTTQTTMDPDDSSSGAPSYDCTPWATHSA